MMIQKRNDYKTKRYIKDLKNEELRKVIENNEDLQMKVLDILQEDSSYYVQEILDSLDLENYNIDFYGYSFIKEKDIFSLAKGFLKAEKDFNIFGIDKDNYKTRLEELLKADDEAEEEDEVNAIYDRLEELTDEIKEVVTSFLVGCYDFSTEDIINNFIEFNYQNFGNYFIKDDNFNKIYIIVENSI